MTDRFARRIAPTAAEMRALTFGSLSLSVMSSFGFLTQNSKKTIQSAGRHLRSGELDSEGNG